MRAKPKWYPVVSGWYPVVPDTTQKDDWVVSRRRVGASGHHPTGYHSIYATGTTQIRATTSDTPDTTTKPAA